MVILFSAGGTLGHINPALSFIKVIKEKYKKVKIIFIATLKEKNLEILKTPLIDEIYFIESCGMSKNILKVFYKDYKALLKIKNILKKENVNIAIGMGGYISGLTIYVANKLNIKTMIHEQNSIMGLANKINIKKTNKILLTYPTTSLKKYNNKIRIITNPRYTDSSNIKKINNKNHILITSGTNGSKVINNIMCDLLNIYDFSKYTITFITGKKYYDEVNKNIIKKPNIFIKEFTTDLLKEINLSSLVISRAGSSTLFEILGMKKLAIVIPSPNVTNNHQYYNAKEFSKLNLIKMIEEKELTLDNLYKAILDIFKNENIYMQNINNFKLDNAYTSFLEEVDILLKQGETCEKNKQCK